MAAVGFEQVSKVFADGTRAVDGLDLAIADGEFMVLVGPSGCGKTTALRMLAGLEEVTDGVIRIGSDAVNNLDCGERDIAMVFQNYALYPHMSVYANLDFPLKLSGMPRATRAERIGRTARMLGIEPYLKRRPSKLSGGQRQRVAMGRALVREPQVFLMDEPLSNLDAKLRVQMRSEIAGLQRSLGITTIYVTHDQVEALTMGERIAVMRGGKLQQVTGPQSLYDAPANLFVAGFIGTPPMNLVEATVTAEDGGPHLRIGAHRIRLSDHEAAGVESGRTVVAGVRPENLRLSPTNRGARVLSGKLALRESIGSDLFAAAALDEVPPLSNSVADLAHVVEDRAEAEVLAARRTATITARLSPSTPHRVGEPIAFELPEGVLRLFDRHTGLALQQ